MRRPATIWTLLLLAAVLLPVTRAQGPAERTVGWSVDLDRTRFLKGDSIQIESILGSADVLGAPGFFVLRLRVELASVEAARLVVDIEEGGKATVRPTALEFERGRHQLTVEVEIETGAALRASLQPIDGGEPFGQLWIGPLRTDVPRPPLPYVLDFSLVGLMFRNEDRVKVKGLRGTKPVLEAGGIYEISGDWTLSSRAAASLAVHLGGGEVAGDVPGAEPKVRLDRDGRGSGSFAVRFRIVREGRLALHLFPVDGGVSFGTVNFGKFGGSVLREAVPGELPSTLEEMLRTALVSNPDLQHARAVIEEADARSRQLELALTRDIVSLYHERRRSREELQQRIELQKDRETLYSAGAVHRDEVREAIVERIEAESKLASIDASLRYLLGLGGTGGDEATADTRLGLVRKTTTSHSSLEQIVTLNLENVPARQALQTVRETTQVVIVVDPNIEDRLEKALSVDLGHLEARQAIQAIADVLGLEYEERPYGVFLTAKKPRSRLGGR